MVCLMSDDDRELTSVSLVEISKILEMQDNFFNKVALTDRV